MDLSDRPILQQVNFFHEVLVSFESSDEEPNDFVIRKKILRRSISKNKGEAAGKVSTTKFRRFLYMDCSNRDRRILL